MENNEEKKTYASEDPATGFIIINFTNDQIIYINESFAKMLGFSDSLGFSNYTNNSFKSLVSSEDYLRVYETISEKIKNNEEFLDHLKFHVCTFHKRVVEIDLYARIICTNGNNLIYAYLVNTNDESLIYDFDYVTGLPEAKRFVEHAKRLQSIFEKTNDEQLAILYITISNYNHKSYDEKDKFIEHFAFILKDVFESSLIARLSDTSFAIFAPNKNLYYKIFNLNEKLNEDYGYNHPRFKVGIYKLNKNDSIEDAISKANKTCELISGSNDVMYKYYDDEMMKEQEIYDYVIHNLDNAILNGEIKVFYQPVVRTINNMLVSAEALARWETKDYGLLSPAKFIEPLERTRQIDKLDTFVFKSICKMLREKIDKREPYVPISYNLSRLDFILMDPYQMISEMVNKYEIPHRLIKIEITETIIMQNPDEMKGIISKFRDDGYEIWMDDFGSAYSSLNMLKEFELDEIKLDLAFIKNLSEKGKIIVKNVISMAKELGIQTLTEGVETKEQYTFLKDIGCEKAQGYLFSKPLPFDNMIENVLNKKITIEKPQFRDFFKELSHLDFQTDLPLCVIHCYNDKIDVYYTNETCKKNLRPVFLDTDMAFSTRINSDDSIFKHKILNLCDSLEQKGEVLSFFHSFKNQLFKINAKNIANVNKHFLFVLNIENLTANEIEHVSKLDRTLREISESYSSMAYVDFSTNKFEPMMEDLYNTFKENITFTDSLEQIRKRVYIDDIKKFNDFFELENVLTNIKRNQSSYVIQTFRFYNDRGELYFKNITLIMMSKEEKKFLLVTRNLTPDEETFLLNVNRILIAKEDILHVQNFELTNLEMFLSLIKNTSKCYYFKDLNHKYVGASDAFVSLLGISHISKLIGFNDSEVGFNITNQKIFDIENKVIEERVAIKDVAINYIIKGKIYNGVINIYPIVESKKTKGIFVEFMNEDFDSKTEILTESNLNINNSKGFIESIISYYNEYKYNDSLFTVTKISLIRLDELKQMLGYNYVLEVEKTVAKMLVEKYGNTCVVSHIKYGTFALIRSFKSDLEQTRFNIDLSADIYGITYVANYSTTLFHKIETFKSDNDFEKNIISILTVK